MSRQTTAPGGGSAAAACARCGAGEDAAIRHDALLGASYCVDCHRRNHVDHSRTVEVTVPARFARLFHECARGEIAGPAEALLDAGDDDLAWRDLLVVRLNAFHALAKTTAAQLDAGGALHVRAPWRILLTVLRAARGSEMDAVRAALRHGADDVHAAELHMEAVTAFELLCSQLRRDEPVLAR